VRPPSGGRTLFTTTLSLSYSAVREVDALPQDVRHCFYVIKSSDSEKTELDSRVVNEGMQRLLRDSYVHINLCI
jgi:hypothetical protein